MEKRKFVPKMKANVLKDKNIQLPKIQIRFPENEESNVVAYVSLVFYNSFVVTGFKVIWGKKGLFVAAPSRQGSTSYYDIAYPITKEYRKALYDAILSEVTRQVDIEPWDEEIQVAAAEIDEEENE